MDTEQLQDKAAAAIPAAFPFLKGGEWDFNIDRDMQEFREKEAWTKAGMYAFVCWIWVEPLAEWLRGKRVLEIMAGAGWLARALREKGIDVVATDDHSWPRKHEWTLQTEVEELDALKAIQKYADQTDILVMSWPYMDPTAFLSLQAWAKLKPGALAIYIGEGDGGCTADEEFFQHFEEVEDPAFDEIARKYVTWWGLHDRINLGRYQHPTNSQP
jgi:hypothetical protein